MKKDAFYSTLRLDTFRFAKVRLHYPARAVRILGMNRGGFSEDIPTSLPTIAPARQQQQLRDHDLDDNLNGSNEVAKWQPTAVRT